MTTRSPAFTRRWAALLAAGGGVVGVLAFPEFGWWPMAFVSVAMLSVAVDGRRSRTGAWLGFLFGLGFMLPLVHWTGIYVGPVPWLLLCAAEAVFFALLGAALPRLARLPAAPLWAGAAWVLEEFLRDRLPFGGFPWGRLAFSQAESPLRWFAALGGAPLVTFAVAVGGAGLALLARSAWPFHVRAVAAGAAVVVAVPLLGLALGPVLRPDTDTDTATERIAVIQGGLPDLGSLAIQTRARQVLDNHVRQTLLLAQRVRDGTTPRPDLVLWPENSSDIDPYRDADARREIDRAVKAVGAPVLVGAILQGPGTGRRNAGILWSPTSGPGARYVKRHPVPFAEYIPLRGVAEAVSPDAEKVTDMVAGHGNGLLRGNGSPPIGDVICFEVAYDDLVRSSVRAGAQLLVVQTNNATFGHTAETYQQLAMTQLRAVEHGRTTVQVATTGESAVIGPDGTVRRRSGELYTSAILLDTVPLRTAQTLATRLGAWPEYVLSLLAVLGLAAAVAGDVRSRRRHDLAVDEEHTARTPADEMVST